MTCPFNRCQSPPSRAGVATPTFLTLFCSGSQGGIAHTQTASSIKIKSHCKTLTHSPLCTVSCNHFTSLFTLAPFINPLWLIPSAYCNAARSSGCLEILYYTAYISLTQGYHLLWINMHPVCSSILGP